MLLPRAQAAPKKLETQISEIERRRAALMKKCARYFSTNGPWNEAEPTCTAAFATDEATFGSNNHFILTTARVSTRKPEEIHTPKEPNT